MGKLVFTFASLAYTVDAPWGKGVPCEGMKRLAHTVHQHNIPVTWLVDANSGQVMRDYINEWHKKIGDDIGMMWEHSQAIPSAGDFSAQRQKLRQLFPWSEIAIAAAGQRSNRLLAEVKKAGL